MNKNVSVLLISILFMTSAIADCVMFPIPLADRVGSAQVIIEARVGSRSSRWNLEHSMIFTSNELLISKVYKGSELISGINLNLITSGGTVGNNAIKVDPELQLEEGEIGLFLLTKINGEWVSESGPQGFIRIDRYNATAADVFYSYPAFSIQNSIEKLTGQSATDINVSLTRISISSKRASPSISSISPKSITAGTSSVLTIKGSNFNALRDTSSVQFKNGDNGGLSFVKALKYDYISWTDTMIRLLVRTQAGTGKIRLLIGGNGIANSTDTLKIPFSHLNVVSGDSIGYETQEIGMNLNNGITWKLNKKFYDSTGARGAFIRSLERWRCGTYINWDTLGHLNHSAIKADGVNMCAWDTNSNMPSGVLAQCFSYWSGCFTPGLKWYVNELDIRFRVKPTGSTNWNYTTGNAASNQFHFESVATHELGHGHQLGHVINSTEVMHYSISNGQTKPALTSDDINGGNYVISKSGSSVCGRNIHSKLNSGNCAIVAPNANFTRDKNQACKSETIVFTDSSSGNISAYAWDFGAGANPATANTKGPHAVVYSNGGNKIISLTITTINGNLITSKNLQIQNDSKMKSDFSFIAAEKGNVIFTNASNNPLASKWFFGDGDSSSLSAPVHQYPSGGSFDVKLLASNTCNSDDTIKTILLSYLNFYAGTENVCILEPVTYYDSSDNNAISWTWTFNGATPASAVGKGPHAVIYNTPGSKSVTLNIGVTGGMNQTYTRNTIVNVGNDTISKADFLYGYYGKNIVGFENKSSGSNMQYKWYFGDGDSSIEKHPVHTYTNANNQFVRLIVNGNCQTDDTTIQLRNFTGLNTIKNYPETTIYPNPANDFISFQNEKTAEILLEIADLSGRIILKTETMTGEMIDVRNIPDGTYLLTAVSMNDYKRIIFIINH